MELTHNQTARMSAYTLLAVVTLLALYVLSFGPVSLLVMLLIDKNSTAWNDFGDALRAFYWPLTAISGKCPAFGQAMIWYMQLWFSGWQTISGQQSGL